MDNLKKYRVPCDWRVCGTLFIEAESEEEARRIALAEAKLPADSEYLDDSFHVDCEDIEELDVDFDAEFIGKAE